MFTPIQSLGVYLNPENGHRIVGLFASDPFAIFGFMLLVLMIPTAWILLMVVARRSVYSIFDGIRHEGRYRRFRRSARISVLPTMEGRESLRSRRATAGTKRVSFRMPKPPHAHKTPMRSESASMLGLPEHHAQPSAPHRTEEPSPTGSDFDHVYDRWVEGHRPPRVEVDLEGVEAKQRWTSEFREQLQRSASRSVRAVMAQWAAAKTPRAGGSAPRSFERPSFSSTRHHLMQQHMISNDTTTKGY